MGAEYLFQQTLFHNVYLYVKLQTIMQCIFQQTFAYITILCLNVAGGQCFHTLVIHTIQSMMLVHPVQFLLLLSLSSSLSVPSDREWYVRPIMEMAARKDCEYSGARILFNTRFRIHSLRCYPNRCKWPLCLNACKFSASEQNYQVRVLIFLSGK